MRDDAYFPKLNASAPTYHENGGMTVRAEIASRCLQAIVSRNGVNWTSEIVSAGYAVKLADALIRELNKPTAEKGEK